MPNAEAKQQPRSQEAGPPKAANANAWQTDALGAWDGAELAAMAAAWDAAAIDRCIIQAHFAQRGYIDDEEIGWLHIPEDWMQLDAPNQIQEGAKESGSGPRCEVALVHVAAAPNDREDKPARPTPSAEQRQCTAEAVHPACPVRGRGTGWCSKKDAGRPACCAHADGNIQRYGEQ